MITSIAGIDTSNINSVKNMAARFELTQSIDESDTTSSRPTKRASFHVNIKNETQPIVTNRRKLSFPDIKSPIKLEISRIL